MQFHMIISHISGHVVMTGDDCYRSQHKARHTLMQRLRGLLWAWPGGPGDRPSGIVRTYDFSEFPQEHWNKGGSYESAVEKMKERIA